MSDDIQSQIEIKQDELRSLRMQARLLQAAENRAQQRAAMHPAILKEDQATDDLYANVFTTSDGMKVLAHLETVRPVVADEIKERVTRSQNAHNAASAATSNNAASGVTVNGTIAATGPGITKA